jgi:hypothetical protein
MKEVQIPAQTCKVIRFFSFIGIDNWSYLYQYKESYGKLGQDRNPAWKVDRLAGIASLPPHPEGDRL